MKAFTFLQQMQRVPHLSISDTVPYLHKISPLYLAYFRPSMVAKMGETEPLFDGWTWQRRNSINSIQEVFLDPLGKFALIYHHQQDQLDIYTIEGDFFLKAGAIKNATLQTLDTILNHFQTYGIEALWNLKTRTNYFQL